MFGGSTYCNPGWPTRDHIIPWRLFEVLESQLHHGQLAQAQAISWGIGLSFGDQEIRELLEDR